MSRFMTGGIRTAAALLLVAIGCVSGTAHAQTTVEYVHTDALGSPVAVTDQAGVVIDRNDYEPYGAVIGEPGYQGVGYTGHVQDASTSLTYMQQRYYDAATGIFLSIDPVGPLSNPVGMFNRYKYAANNPYRFIDPDGRQEKTEREEPVTGTRISNNTTAKAMLVTAGSGLVSRGESKPHTLGSGARANFRDRVDNSSLLGPGGKEIAHFIGDPIVDAASKAADGNYGDSVKSAAIGLVLRRAGPLGKKIEELVSDAQQKFPNKAGRYEMHHVYPKYLGGSPAGETVRIDAAYHQQITNSFRQLWPYGGPKPTEAEAKAIMSEVYSKYPVK